MSIFKRQDQNKLKEQLESLGGGSTYENNDEKEWKLTRDEQDNGVAVIRFLPAKPNTNMISPFVSVISHGGKVNGRWYIENCPTTVNKHDYDSCPVCKFMGENDTYNTNKELYGQLRRQTNFWANILVIKDPKNKENEGKVFKYRFGKKIFDKIRAKADADPTIGEKPIDVTCVFGGANFILKSMRKNGFVNYDESSFQDVSEIARIDEPEFQNYLFENMEDLSELIAPDKFKSFEENQKNFNRMMNIKDAKGAAAALDAFDAELNAFDAKGSDDINMDNIVMEETTSVGTVTATETETSAGSEDAWLDELLK